MGADIAAFLGISALVIVTPGQDTALTIRNTLVGGRHGGVFTAAGVAGGQAVWTLAAAVGLTALLLASEPAFLAVKLAGAAYLVYLGGQSLLAAVRGSRAHTLDAGAAPGAPRGRAFRQGLVSNLGNPKMAVFFTSLLPQFAPGGHPAFPTLLLLGLVFATMTLAWLSAYAFVVAKAGDLLRRSRVRRTLEALTGTVLVALGVRLASAQR